MQTHDLGLNDDTTWYLANARGKKAGPRLVGLIRQMAQQQATLRANTDLCMAVFQWGGAAKDCAPVDHFPIEQNVLAFNQAKNTVETVHAKVFKSKIAPMPLTSGAGYLARYRAKQLGKALEGVMAANDVDSLEREMGFDALTTDHGAGAVKVIECDDRIEIQQVPIEDVWFDEAEVRQRSPRSCFHIPRDGWDTFVAIETFARDNDDYAGLVGTAESRANAIRKAASSAPAEWRVHNSTVSRVDIFEAWHLPSGKIEEVEEEYDDEETGEKKTRTVRKHDGRHVVAVDGEDGTLIDEPWDGEGGFPILLYVPRKRRRHIFGMSLMRDLIAPQREYEKLTAKIQSSHQKMGVAGWHTTDEANLNVREITAGTWGQAFVVSTATQQAPTPLVVEPVAQGTYAYAASLPRDMNARNGVSEMSANSQIPAGLSQASGKALQVFDDSEDVRLSPYHVERETWKVKLSWLVVHAAARIIARRGKFESTYRGKNSLEKLDWAELVKDKDFEIRVFPVSELAKQPSAKFAQLSELLDRQAITVDQFKRLFEIPDLESELAIDEADTNIIDRRMDQMVTTGKYFSPEPFDNLELIIRRAGKFYNMCRDQEVPEARLKLLRNYMADARALKEEADAAQAAKAPPPMPGPPPMGPPGMAPPEGPLPGMPPMPMPPPGAPPMPMAA